MRELLRNIVRAFLAGIWPRFAQPTLSTYGGFLRDPGYDGELADQNNYEADTFVNTESIAINFGFAVARDTSSSLVIQGSNALQLLPCKAPTSDTDPIIGFALRHAIMPALGPAEGGTNLVQYVQNAPVPVLRNGSVWKIPYENVSAGDQVVSITAQNGALGSAANNAQDATAAAAGNAKATGTITMTNQPVAGDTVTVNGVVITFVAAVTEPYQVLIGATKQNTATNLQVVLSDSINPLLTVAEYTVSGAVVTITYQLGGTGGNAYTLVTSDATNIALSGATLASGAANTGNATIALSTQPEQFDAINGVYTIVCTAATTANVFRPNGDLLGTCTFGTQFNDEIIFTITAGGTACVAGDSFEVTVGAGRVPVQGAFWQQTGGPNGVALLLRINNNAS
jgi:hypothetical protein